MKRIFNDKTVRLLLLSLMFVGLLFLSLAGLQAVSAQNNNAGIIIQVNAGTDNILITEVEYEVLRLGDPYTYIQTSSDEILVGPDFQTALDGINKAGNPLPNNVAVNIIRIDFAGGSLVPTAQFPTTSNFNTQVGNPIVAPSEFQVVLPDQEIPHFVGDLLATNPVYFERIDDVISIPDMRSYWDLSGNALGDATEANPQNFTDVLYRNPILPGDLVVVSERAGNTPMSFTPLDQNVDVIINGATVSIAGSPLYQWDIRISHATNVTNQTQWLIMFDASLFYVGDSVDVYGWRVNMTTTDDGDGKIL